MPLIFRFLQFVFSFKSLDHLPPHVHVKNGNNATIFDLIIENGILIDIKTRSEDGYEPLKKQEQNVAKAFIRVYYAQIVAKWVDYYILNKKIKPETIKKIDNISVNSEELISHIEELNKHFYPTEKKQPAKTKSKKK